MVRYFMVLLIVGSCILVYNVNNSHLNPYYFIRTCKEGISLMATDVNTAFYEYMRDSVNLKNVRDYSRSELKRDGQAV